MKDNSFTLCLLLPTKKSFNADFCICKPVQNTSHTNREFNIRTRMIDKCRVMVERNYPAHLKVMNWRSRLTRKRDKPPSPKSTEVRNNREINQAWSPKPRLTSRAGLLNRKATLLTLEQEHLTSFQEQWRNWSDTLKHLTVTDVSHTS